MAEIEIRSYQPSQCLTRHARAWRGHPRLRSRVESKTWMAGTSPAMTGREHRPLRRLVSLLTLTTRYSLLATRYSLLATRYSPDSTPRARAAPAPPGPEHLRERV